MNELIKLRKEAEDTLENLIALRRLLTEAFDKIEATQKTILNIKHLDYQTEEVDYEDLARENELMRILGK